MVKKTKPTTNITKTQARKVLQIVDAGLSCGLGRAVPGQMCVEAAVAFALGYDFNDHPKCVTPTIRDAKIAINDWHGWGQIDGDMDSEKTNKERSKALRRLALAQLGSAGVISNDAWNKAMALYALKKNGELVEHNNTVAKYKTELLQAIYLLEAGKEVSIDIHQSSLIYDLDFEENILNQLTDIKSVKRLCEDLVKILIKLKSPGTKFLDLTRK